MFYLMKEADELFWCEADDREDAEEAAAMWNAVVLRKASPKEEADQQAAKGASHG